MSTTVLGLNAEARAYCSLFLFTPLPRVRSALSLPPGSADLYHARYGYGYGALPTTSTQLASVKCERGSRVCVH